MPVVRTLIDTNILVYALGTDAKGELARQSLADGYILSVQALNEFVRVATAKLRFDWPSVDASLELFRANAIMIQPVDIAVHERALQLLRRYRLGTFDSLMIAAGLIAECERVLSEDMQHGLVIDDILRIENPFAQDPH